MLCEVSHYINFNTHAVMFMRFKLGYCRSRSMPLRACPSHTLALRLRAGRRLDQSVHSEAGAHANAGGCSRGRPGAVPQVHALHYAA